jgi:hypothetical protein
MGMGSKIPEKLLNDPEDYTDTLFAIIKYEDDEDLGLEEDYKYMFTRSAFWLGAAPYFDISDSRGDDDEYLVSYPFYLKLINGDWDDLRYGGLILKFTRGNRASDYDTFKLALAANFTSE